MNSQVMIEFLDGLSDAQDEEQLKMLDEVVQQVKSDEPPEVIQSLLRVFERFPDENGFEVFWSIVHALEHVRNYEIHLIDWLRRQPSEFGVLMINRLLNSGVNSVGSHDLLKLIRWTESQSDASVDVKRMAHGFLEYQKNKS